MLFKKNNIILVLLLAFFLRIYRLPDLLGFWYDQGRDALVIWDFIHNGKLFLIGPMMGFTGMFRGPWYYYLITPFYYLGNGNPIWPSVFLVITSVIAIYVLFIVAKEMGGEKVGLFASFIAGMSVYIIGASRWLSNPTPTLLIGISLVWAIFRFLDKKKWSIPLVSFLIGMGLNFGAATEIYYIPAVIIILWLNRKLLPNFKIIILSIIIFIGCFIPQIIFEIRHPVVLSLALYNFVFNHNTFTFNFVEILTLRLTTYYNIFSSKFWLNGNSLFMPFFIILLILLKTKWKNFWIDNKFKVLFFLFLAPFIGTLFFVSNLGGFYDYYFTGYYLIFILFFSTVFIKITQYKFGKYILLLFLLIFVYKNFVSYSSEYQKPINHAEIIAFKNQELAIDWIKNDVTGDFNVDVYVPPVIPYAYDYLFLWKSLGNQEKQAKLLYTLYEVDPPHPERLNAWLARQEGIGNVVYEERFGGITVQRRERINYEK